MQRRTRLLPVWRLWRRPIVVARLSLRFRLVTDRRRHLRERRSQSLHFILYTLSASRPDDSDIPSERGPATSECYCGYTIYRCIPASTAISVRGTGGKRKLIGDGWRASKKLKAKKNSRQKLSAITDPSCSRPPTPRKSLIKGSYYVIICIIIIIIGIRY